MEVVDLNELTEVQKKQVEIVLNEEWNYEDGMPVEDRDYTTLFQEGIGLPSELDGGFIIDTWQVGDVRLSDAYHFPGDTQAGYIFLAGTTTKVAIIHDAYVYDIDDEPNSINAEQAATFSEVRYKEYNEY